MKKLICTAIAIMLFCTAWALADTAYVSISDGQGNLVMALEPVELADMDNDGVISIADALTIAHDQAYEGGSEAGFIAEDQGYGLSIYKLWGEENGSSYGYYVNNVSAYSLSDPIADGDHVKAYVYTDLTSWSDTYCYFEVDSAEGNEVALSLIALVFDADWNQVAVPVEGAIITVDGEDTDIVTDAEGKAAFTVEEAGEYLISARSESMVLVPPVCILNTVFE